MFSFYVNQSLSLCIEAYVKKYLSLACWNEERSRESKNVNESFRDAISIAVAITLRSESVINFLQLPSAGRLIRHCCWQCESWEHLLSCHMLLFPPVWQYSRSARLLSTASLAACCSYLHSPCCQWVFYNLHFKGQLEARTKYCLVDARKRPSKTALLWPLWNCPPRYWCNDSFYQSGTSSRWIIVYRNDTHGAAVPPWRWLRL